MSALHSGSRKPVCKERGRGKGRGRELVSCGWRGGKEGAGEGRGGREPELGKGRCQSIRDCWPWVREKLGSAGGADGQEPTCQFWRRGLDPWVSRVAENQTWLSGLAHTQDTVAICSHFSALCKFESFQSTKEKNGKVNKKALAFFEKDESQCVL